MKRKLFRKKMWASAWEKFQSTYSNDSEWITTPEILAILKEVARAEKTIWQIYTEIRAKGGRKK